MRTGWFQPKPWPTAIAVVGVIILIGLGSWQVHRRVWKTELLDTINAGMQAAPVPLPGTIEDPEAWSFRLVRIEGRFANDRVIKLYGRVHDGKAGIHLLVPLIREGQPPVLVDRGFVPFAQGSDLVPFRKVDGPTTVDGVVRLPEPAGRFTPANDPIQNVWYDIDMAEMSRLTNLDLAPVYVAVRPSGTEFPAGTGGTESLGIRNEHLNYAIFWYSMAAVLAAIYVLSSRSCHS